MERNAGFGGFRSTDARRLCVCAWLLPGQLAIEVAHLLKQRGKTAHFVSGPGIERDEEWLAEPPGAAERPQPAGMDAAAGRHCFAGAFKRFHGIAVRNWFAQQYQIPAISFPVKSVLLPATDVRARRADDGSIFLDERGRIDQELFEPLCRSDPGFGQSGQKKIPSTVSRDIMMNR